MRAWKPGLWILNFEYRLFHRGAAMTTVQPEGEQIRKAVKWIAAEKMDNPGKSRLKLIEEAGVKFDLSPAEEEYLTRLLCT